MGHVRVRVRTCAQTQRLQTRQSLGPLLAGQACPLRVLTSSLSIKGFNLSLT